MARPSEIYPNVDFGFENIPSGNPALEHCCKRNLIEIVERFLAKH
jgi:hypothetical protein